jgi:hypothetical protein
VTDVDELELRLVGSAVEPVARPMQVLEVQVPNVDQPVGVENVEEDEVAAPPAGVEPETVPHALPQPQLVYEADQVRLELETGVVLEVDVDVDTRLSGDDAGEVVVDRIGGVYDGVLDVVLVVLDVTLLDVVEPRQEQPVNNGLMFCA